MTPPPSSDRTGHRLYHVRAERRCGGRGVQPGHRRPHPDRQRQRAAGWNRMQLSVGFMTPRNCFWGSRNVLYTRILHTHKWALAIRTSKSVVREDNTLGRSNRERRNAARPDTAATPTCTAPRTASSSTRPRAPTTTSCASGSLRPTVASGGGGAVATLRPTLFRVGSPVVGTITLLESDEVADRPHYSMERQRALAV
jgi:hypothetical protein